MPACPRCGEPTDDRARFCPACGIELSELGRPREMRKTVTVVFADVAGSTALGEELDPETVRRVMARYFDEARTVVERHGGIVEKFIGDAVMAVFGIPTLHEDDALRGLRAAEELRGRLGGLAEELERWGVRLELRIGVNTGEVVAGEPGEGQAFATGDAVNVAARLQQAAAPGEVLVGPATYSHVRDAARFDPVVPLALKGKSERVVAWRLVEVLADVPPFSRALETSFVGRHQELVALEAAFERARSTGTCQLVTVLGPPGVGKSRVARELLSSVGAQASVVVGRCLPYGEGITYWPLTEIVKQIGGSEPAALRELVADEEDADLIVKGVAGALGAVESGVRAEEIFWAVRRLFEALARERPFIAVVDDIHWAQPTLLDLLEYLASFGSARLLVLCTARPDLLDVRPGWRTPRENAGVVALEPLSDVETDALMDDLVQGAGLSDRLRRHILTAAEGNPLFVEQMVALARESNGDGEPTVPPTIQALLAARIDRLEPGERAVLERASVEGRVFHRGAVSPLLSERERERLPTHLMALVRKELIRPDRSELAGEDGFRFAHTLIRDAAYEGLPKEARAELHERFADWVEERSPALEEIIGYHLEQAVRYRSQLGGAGEREAELAHRAGSRLASAGQRAFRRGDMPAAANLLDRAASLLAPEAPERLELLTDLGSALGESGELARAETVLREAAERAHEAGDVRLEWRALLQRSFLNRYTHFEAGADELLAVAERAIRAFEEVKDEVGLSRAWRLVAEAHWTRCQIGRMESCLEQALAHARRAGEEQEILLILDGLARAALVGPTPVDEAIRRCESILEQASGSRTLEAVVAMIQAYLEAMRGRFGEARALYEDASAKLEDLGQVVYLAALRAWIGEIEMLAGNVRAAERFRRQAYEALAGLNEKGILSTVAAYLAETLVAQGRDEEAAGFTVVSEEAAASDDVTSQILWRSARAKVLSRRGKLEEAEELAAEAVVLAEEADAPNLHGDALISRAEVLDAAGRADEAAASVAEAVRLYESKGNVASASFARLRLEGGVTTATFPGDRAS
jgi:class 3 adenylate cyclase/tetratricopeptide (TPR) repeat protein